MLNRFSHCGLSYPRFEQITDVTSYLVACLQVDTKNASSSLGAHLYQEHTRFYRLHRVHAPYFSPCHLTIYLETQFLAFSMPPLSCKGPQPHWYAFSFL